MDIIALPILKYAIGLIEALENVDDGGDVFVRDIQICWYGEPTNYYIVADEFGGYGLTVKEDNNDG